MRGMRDNKYRFPASVALLVIGVVAFVGSLGYVSLAQEEEIQTISSEDTSADRNDSFVQSGDRLTLAEESVVQVSPSSEPSPSTAASAGEVAGTISDEDTSDTTNLVIQGGGFLQLLGQLKDKLGSTGSRGQVLMSQGGSKPPQWAAVVPPGSIQFYAGMQVPEGWLECDGQELSEAAYPDLFAAIGTTWGDGNGEGAFNVPDLRGRVPIGAGDGDGDDDTLTERRLADSGGEEKHTLTNAELPANDYLSGGGILTHTIENGVDVSRTFYGDTGTSTTSVTGQGQKLSVVQPFTVVRCIIKT